MGQGKDGKQPIQIDWSVNDPKGKKLGTVSQKNEIPPGSLDGAGARRRSRGAAAAQGIMKLLPQGRTNANWQRAIAQLPQTASSGPGRLPRPGPSC